MFILDIIKAFILGHKGGLLPHKEDERDFQFGWLFGQQPYQPKHDVWEVKTCSIKNQYPFNTCVWNSATSQKEVQEGVPLSVKHLVATAKSKGLLWGNGFAYLRSAQQLLTETGPCEESMCPDEKTSWDTYSADSSLTYTNGVNGTSHKSDKYFLVQTKDETLKALDDGYAIQTGLMWMTGYNNPPADAILKVGTGASVGGHAVLIVGYDITRGLLKFQNSFGDKWGDKGFFYIRFDEWFKLGNFGYVTVDVAQKTLWSMYEGKDVKGSGPAIYRIVNGKKCVFLNEKIFFKNGGSFSPRTWVQISDSLLKSIPEGKPMV